MTFFLCILNAYKGQLDNICHSIDLHRRLLRVFGPLRPPSPPPPPVNPRVIGRGGVDRKPLASKDAEEASEASSENLLEKLGTENWATQRPVRSMKHQSWIFFPIFWTKLHFQKTSSQIQWSWSNSFKKKKVHQNRHKLVQTDFSLK